MQRHGEAVRRYCRGQLRDVALADDVHQQVFIEVYRDLSKFERRSTVWTWLFAIARHRVWNAARSRSRCEAREMDLAEIADVHDPRPSPLEFLDEMRQLELVMARVRELPDAMRVTLMLRYQLGFTFEEMADICGERAGTLQARASRALAQFRAAMEPR